MFHFWRWLNNFNYQADLSIQILVDGRAYFRGFKVKRAIHLILVVRIYSTIKRNQPFTHLHNYSLYICIFDFQEAHRFLF